MSSKWLACLAVVLGGCPSADIDEGEDVGSPQVEFDPANKIIPFPNNLLLDPATGKVNLPAQCNESAATKATREGVLNTLDGFGTYQPALNVTFSEAVDTASLTDRVVLLKRATGTTPVDPATAQAIPVVAIPNQTTRFLDQTDLTACADPVMVDQVTFIPALPLEQKSVYTVALLTGIKTASGADFTASFTWELVRSPEPVVVIEDGVVTTNRTPLDPRITEDFASLEGINLLWNAHQGALTFLDETGLITGRNDVLLAWEFKTQTTTDALDQSVAGSPAALTADTPPIQGVARVVNGVDGPTFLAANLPPGTCTVLPCNAVGEILAGGLISAQYQIDTPNAFDDTKPIPGPWGNPNTPTKVKDEAIITLIATPAGGCPTGGCPTVIFGHGLGSSKTTMFAIVSQMIAASLAQAPNIPFNVVAIDVVAHDSRAKRISDDPLKGCDGTPTPTTKPQCFAPFLSTNLATTRDNIRQSIIDVQSLAVALSKCTEAAPCGASANRDEQLIVDPARIVYAGISLGGILGTTATATSGDIKAAVLNVPAVGWADILENSNTLAIKCPLVDGLIDAGILVGDKLDPVAGTGLCIGDEWKTQPGYRQFAVIGRWILDPGDGANYTSRLAASRFLIQRVDGDLVVPNIATDREAALAGVPVATPADCGNAAQPTPSAAILTNGMSNKFVSYPTVAPGTAGCTPGNTYDHAALLRPAVVGRCATETTTSCNPALPVGSNGCPGATETCNQVADGQLATARLQTDAITFLLLNR